MLLFFPNRVLGGEPVLVGGDELVVVVLAFLQFFEEGGADSECCGGAGEGDLAGLSLGADLGGVGCWYSFRI